MRYSTCARSTSEKPGPSVSTRQRSSSCSAGLTSPRSMRAHASVCPNRASSSIAPRRENSRTGVLELLDRRVVLMRVRERLGAGQHALDAAALVGGDALLEEAGVGAELGGEPRDRLARGPGLAALDLADVLLRKAVAGEVGLGQAGGHP